MLALLAKTLQGSALPGHQQHRDFPWPDRNPGFHHHQVTVQDAVADHRIALHFQHIGLASGREMLWHQHWLVFKDRVQRRSGSDPTQPRQGAQRHAHGLPIRPARQRRLDLRTRCRPGLRTRCRPGLQAGCRWQDFGARPRTQAQAVPVERCHPAGLDQPLHVPMQGTARAQRQPLAERIQVVDRGSGRPGRFECGQHPALGGRQVWRGRPFGINHGTSVLWGIITSPTIRKRTQREQAMEQQESAAATAVGADDPAHRLADELVRRYGERITARIVQPARPARLVAFPAWLDPSLCQALQSRGITRLYSHQAEALASARRGEHLVVVTPTASGKSLCFNLPVLQAVREAGAKALYLFPTKALAQDQVAELNALNQAAAFGVRAFTFDGDTPADARQAVRLKGDIVVSNPDMLHQGILPHHTKWAAFFEGLRYVVIDEMHTYRGVFGSHVANVLRRLRRIAAFYGSTPQFILCSATLANPVELASGLIGAPVTAVDQTGAPCGERHLLLWNPPVINPDLGIRASNRSQTTRIARLAVQRGLKTIVFANSRLMVEVLTKYLKDAFERDIQPTAHISAYRGGYLPNERRRTEQALRGDQVDCVVSTSALELGVDIGSLDVCILNGYPGSIAGTWQRLGRAGRRGRTALGVLVASSDALDQYLVRNPEFFDQAPVEHGRIAPDQLLILMEHLRCAAFELPFRRDELFGNASVEEHLAYLAEQGVLHLEADRWHWMSDSYPANAVSLRSVADGNFLVIDQTDQRKDVIAEVDYSAAAMTLYEGAIYLVQAQPYQVERLDWTGRKAFVRSTRVDYYTDAIDYTHLRILDTFETRSDGPALCARGEVHLLRRVPGYKKIRYYSHENVGYGNISLPDHEMHTSSLWWQVDPAVIDQHFARRSEALDGFLGAAHALHLIAALRSMAERQDLGRAVGDGNGEWFATVGADSRGNARRPDGSRFDPEQGGDRFVPTVFLYDNFPGGVGLSEPLLALAEEIVQGAADLIGQCPCPQGCPACVGPILASEAQRGFSPKAAASRILSLLGARAWI